MTTRGAIVASCFFSLEACIVITLRYPKSGTTVRTYFAAYGHCCPHVNLVVGRVRKRSGGGFTLGKTVLVQNGMWVIVFSGLDEADGPDRYDMQIQYGVGKFITCKRLRTIAPGSGAQIDYPDDGTALSPDFVSTGTTDTPGQPLTVMRMDDGTVQHQGLLLDGPETGQWTIGFSGIPELPEGSTYTLEVGHSGVDDSKHSLVVDEVEL